MVQVTQCRTYNDGFPQVLSCMMEKPMMELVRPNFFRWTPLENDYLLSNVIAPIEDSVNFAHVRAALAAGTRLRPPLPTIGD
jgi:hypothetical protein